MKIPTIQIIQAYIDDKGYNIDAEAFFNYNETRGWRTKEGPMKSWHGNVGYCARMGFCKTPASTRRLARRNVQTAHKEREHQREMYEEYLKSKTVRALNDLKENPGALKHVVWLIDEVIRSKTNAQT